eukprot:934262-Pyramimonas_sp.AAC.1
MNDERHGKELVHSSSSSSGHQVPQPVHQAPQPVHQVPHPAHQVSQPARPVPLQATAGQLVPDDSLIFSENFDMSRPLSEIMADSSRQEPDQTASMGPADTQDKSAMEVSSQDHQMSTPSSSTAVPLTDIARP